MAYQTYRHGAAEYGQFAELNNSQIATLTSQEGTDSLTLSAQRFAQLTYQVNPTPIQISGAVFDIGDVGIIDTTTNTPVKVTTNNELKVSDSAVLSALTTNYDIIIEPAGTDITYIMRALIGSSQNDPVWQIKKITAPSGLVPNYTGWPVTEKDTFTCVAVSANTYNYTND